MGDGVNKRTFNCAAGGDALPGSNKLNACAQFGPDVLCGVTRVGVDVLRELSQSSRLASRDDRHL